MRVIIKQLFANPGQFSPDQPDIWNLVLSAIQDDELTLNEMYSNADLFMVAGSETSGKQIFPTLGVLSGSMLIFPWQSHMS